VDTETHIGLVLSLLFDPFGGLFSFFLAFDLTRNGADFDPGQTGGKICVEAERISGADVP
jgi:hypothetical protein